MRTGLEVHTLGKLRILRDDKPTVGLSTRKVETLLVYLIKTRQPQQLERLANLLGLDRNQSQGLKNLRVILSHWLMMRLVVTSGQRSAALNQYERFQKLPRNEHSKVSESETIHLYGQIRTGKIALLPGVAAI